MHFNNTNSLSDKSDEYGFDEHQNSLIRESKIVLAQIKKYETLVSTYVRRRSSSGTNLIAKDKQVQIIKLSELVFTAYKAIASDVDYENVKNDKKLLSDVGMLLASGDFALTLAQIGLSTARWNKIKKTFDEIKILLDGFISFKERNHLSFKDKWKNRLNTFKKNLPKGKKANLLMAGKIGLAGLGIGLAKFAAIATKSGGIEKLKYPATLWLAKIGYDVKKQRDARLNLIRQISSAGTELHSNLATGSIRNRLAGGGSYVAKRNAPILIGDNPGGKEKFVIKRGPSSIGGKTAGPTLMNMKIGDKINASPLSGKGVTKVNTNDLSRFGAGTDEEISNTSGVVSAVNRNTSVLIKMWKSQTDYYRDDISRKDDLANANKGIGKSNFSNLSTGQKIGQFIDSKDKGGFVKSVLMSVIEGSTIGAVVKNGLGSTAKTVGKGLMKRAPMIGGVMSGGLTYARTGSLAKGVGSGIGSLGGAIGGAKLGATIGSFITPGVGTAIGAAIGTVAGGLMGDKLGTFVGGVFEDWKTYWDKIKEWFQPFLSVMGKIGGGTIKAVTSGYGAAKSAVSNAFSAGKEAIGMGSRSVRNNNPGNIKVPVGGLEVARARYNDPNISIDPNPASDGGHFLKFSSVEKGKAAIPKLLKTTSSNLSVNDALRKWSNNAYGDEIVPALKGKTIGSLNESELTSLQNAMQNREGWKPAAINRNANLPSQIDAAQSKSPLSKVPVPSPPMKFKQAQVEVSMATGLERMKINEQEASKRAYEQSLLGSITNMGNTIINNVNNGGGGRSTPSIVSSGDGSLVSLYTAGLSGGF